MRGQCARRQPLSPTIVGASSFLGIFVVLGCPPPSVGGSNPRSSIRAWAAGRCGFAVTGVSCDDSLVKSESPGSNAARVGAFLLGKRNTVLVTTLPERGFFSHETIDASDTSRANSKHMVADTRSSVFEMSKKREICHRHSRRQTVANRGWSAQRWLHRRGRRQCESFLVRLSRCAGNNPIADRAPCHR